MKKKTIITFAIALCLAIVLLLLLQALLVPKYMASSQEGALIAEYYDQAGNNDVIFVGDCEVYENFSPITLWEKYGITSYIRGSAQQLIWQSYYLMEETFRYEKPKVMVFNVLSMKYDTPASTGREDQREAYNRMTLDGMRWSSSKWNAIQASMTDKEKEKNAMWGYLFPLLRYHDRWWQLTGEDFRYMFHRDQVSENGYLMQTGVNPLTEHIEKPLLDYHFAEGNFAYLDKMVELCEKHGTQLVLIKAPSRYPKWHDQWETQIEEYAKKKDLLYINFLEHEEEIGIDWNTDTYAYGLHLNVYVAEKLSDYFGKILAEQCGVPDRRSEQSVAVDWAKKAETYYARKARLEAETRAEQ